MLSYAKYSTAFGVGAVVSTAEGVVEVLLPFGVENESLLAEDMSRRQCVLTGRGGYAVLAAQELELYFTGRRLEFSVPVDFKRLSLFAGQVCRQVASIGYGEVRTYGEIAAAVRAPRAARAVGAVMAANRVPIIIPCHRVVAGDGAMCGYSAAGGIATKKLLLQLEGVGFSSLEKVLLNGSANSVYYKHRTS